MKEKKSELEKRELEIDLEIERNGSQEGEDFCDDTEILKDESQIVVENLMNRFTDPTEEVEETDTEKVAEPFSAYERDTESLDIHNNLVYTGKIAEEKVLFSDTKAPRQELFSKNKQKNKNSSKETLPLDKKIRKYYGVVVSIIIVFLLMVTFLLVLQTKALERSMAALKNGTNTNDVTYDPQFVAQLTAENNRLQGEVDKLKEELQNSFSSSSAEVVLEEDAKPASKPIIPTAEVQQEPPAASAPAKEVSSPTIQEGTQQPSNPPQVENTQKPQPVVPTPETKKPETYVVQPGDTLSKIAQRIYGDKAEYKRIMEANKLANDKIKVGQKIIIP